MKSKSGRLREGTKDDPAGCDGERASWRPEFMLQFSPVLHQLARTFWAFKQAYANQFNLPLAAIGVLAVLGDRDGLTQQELTATLRLDPSMITRSAKELEHEHGWIRRERDPADNRLMRVYLTEEGRNQAAELSKRAIEIEQRLLRDLSEEDCTHLRQMLRTVENTARQEQHDAAGKATSHPAG